LNEPAMTAPVQNAASTASARRSTPNEDEAQRAVAAAVETHRLGFLHLDPVELASIWDREHEPLVYVAQEKEEPILGWAAIQRYLAALPEHLEEVLAKDLDKGRPTKYEPIGHVTMMFRRTSEGWRAIHFHESARSAQAAQAAQVMQAKP
jgi:hypothetical protein